MKRFSIVLALCIGVAAPALGSSELPQRSIKVAQVPTGATGGVSGGPNQQQAIRDGATGGRSGGPNQQQAKRSHKKAKKAKKAQ